MGKPIRSGRKARAPGGGLCVINNPFKEMKKIQNWFREKLSSRTLLVILILFFAADLASFFIWNDTNNKDNLQIRAEVPAPNNDKDEYIRQLEAYITDAEDVNKQWVSAQSNWQKMKTEYDTKIASLEADKTKIAKTMAEDFQARINDLSKNMVDLTWQNSLINDMLDLVPAAGTTYTQELKDINIKIATIRAHVWAGVGVCAYLDSYIKQGLLSSRGAICERNAQISSSIK